MGTKITKLTKQGRLCLWEAKWVRQAYEKKLLATPLSKRYNVLKNSSLEQSILLEQRQTDVFLIINV